MTRVTPVELVLFDLDDTLLDHAGASRIGLAQHLDAIGLAGRDGTGFDRWHDLEEQHYHRYLAGEVDIHEQRRARAREFLAPLGLVLATDADADAWFGALIAAVRAAWSLFDDVVPCLQALGDRRIGIITNGEREYQRAKLVALGLDRRVAPVVCSGAVGVVKPDARIFELACAEAGIAPDRACYVGDRLRTDAIGAAEAGLLGVWLDRGGRATAGELAEAGTAGAAVIRSLAELPHLVG